MAHGKGCDKVCPKGKKRCTCGTATLGKEKVAYRAGALRRQLGLSASQKLTRASLDRLKKVEVGKDFSLFGKKHRMTALLKQRVSLGRTLMGKGGGEKAKPRAGTKGAASKTRPGGKDYETNKRDKDFHRGGHDEMGRGGKRPY